MQRICGLVLVISYSIHGGAAFAEPQKATLTANKPQPSRNQLKIS